MAEIYEFPKTSEQRNAEERLIEAIRNFNEAVKCAARYGFEIKLMPVNAFMPGSAAPLPLISVAAQLPCRPKRPEYTEI